jgi:single-strand DNA-binding protein
MNGNYVRLYGFAGHDPIIKRTTDGSKMAIIRVATHHWVSDKTDSTKKQCVTTWHSVVAWDAQAEFAERNFVRCSKILVEGRLVYRTGIDKAGNIINITDIRAESLDNLDR